MSLKLTESEISEIRTKYYYLVNYTSEDPNAPIDPANYVDSNGDNLLHIAAQLWDLKTIETLLGGGLDVNQTGDMGCTALHYARMKGREEVANFLLKHGASTSVLNDFGKTPD